jgi:hypothetical protein
MRPVTFQISEQENHKLEILIDVFGFENMTQIFKEGVHVLDMLAKQAEEGFNVPCVLRKGDGRIRALGPNLEYLQNVVERSEDNMVIPFPTRYVQASSGTVTPTT